MATPGGIVKKVLSAGKGAMPTFCNGTRVLVDYEVLTALVDVDAEGFPDDRSLYKTIDNTRRGWPHGFGKPLELVIGKKFQWSALELCVMSMHVDELSQFDVRRELMAAFPGVSKKLRDIARADADPAFAASGGADGGGHCCAAMAQIKTGYDELDDLIAHPRPLRVIVHLKQVERPEEYKADSWQLDETQKRARVDALRVEGNEAFGRKETSVAIEKYREALTLLDRLVMLEKPGDVEWTALDKLNLPLYLNLSQCYLDTNEFRDAAETATEALKRDETNEKALYRRARANLGMWELELAEADADALERAHPRSAAPNAARIRDEARRRRVEKTSTDRNVYKKMVMPQTAASSNN